jgi:hypothetical protein
MQNLTDALIDLANEPTALTEIAAEYGIRADVLLARFVKAHGCQPVEYASKVAHKAASQARQLAEVEENERKAVERELAERRAIAEFFASDRGLGRGIIAAARQYLRATN